MTLAAQQARFGAALRSADAAPSAAALLAGAIEVNQRRLAVYRANGIANACNALRAHYPVVEQVVGVEFFAALARAYWQAHPSASGDLGDYGAAFADFLAQFEPTHTLPYLPDLACVEWAVHGADTAADAPVKPIEREPALLWMPGTVVLVSDHPVADIWNAHQAEAALRPEDIAWVAQGALVFRDGLRVGVAALDPDQARALIELIAEETS